MIFPAEELVEFTLAGRQASTIQHAANCIYHQQNINAVQADLPVTPKEKSKSPKLLRKLTKTKAATKNAKKAGPRANMATGGEAAALRDLTHPGLNESLKAHNAVTFKLVRTGKKTKNCISYFR